MEDFAKFLYLLATTLFIFGIKDMSKVRTARRGNLISAVGMLLAIVTTVMAPGPGIHLSWGLVLVGLSIGSAIGAWLARTVEMTAMPEMVALFNGFGGGASLLVAMAVFWGDYFAHDAISGQPAAGVASLGLTGPVVWVVAIVLSVLVGGVTLTGSLVAMGKLSGKIPGGSILLKGRHLLNLALLLLAVLLAWSIGWSTHGGLAVALLFLLALVSMALGILVVIPIGGADMPVVISLLNSYSGIAASMAGFVIGNSLLIVAGALVGASGLILTNLMCKAMNRSLLNVLVGGFGGDSGGGGDHSDYTNVKSASPEEAAMILEDAMKVIIVPGYGMAVAQAQHVVKALGVELEKRGAEVSYAIHPVAGRMPGHMNVLLAEADVPYEQLFELERINDEFRNADVAIVIGANDVVNPAATDDPSSPIAGMPILNAADAGTVLVIKRSLSPGYAGVKNPLFERDNTLMCFGDGKAFVSAVLDELKEG